jgi:nucleoside-diphosphate-sugar epimerase
MPRILIAGCGYVGQATAKLFCGASWEVEGWTSSLESARELSGEPYAVAAVDIAQRDQVAEHRGNFEGVIHCASSGGGGADAYREIYLQGARNLLENFPDAPVLFASSTSVYAQLDGTWVAEASAAEPIRETGRILRQTEELTLSRGGFVARLAGIYGPGRSFLLQKFLDGQAVIDRERDRFINQVHRDDIAAALFLLMNRRLQASLPARSNEVEIYNVVDDRPILRSECYEWLAARLNRPLPACETRDGPPKRGDSNKRVSNTKLRTCDWKLRYPTFQDAMENSILPSMLNRGR